VSLLDCSVISEVEPYHRFAYNLDNDGLQNIIYLAKDQGIKLSQTITVAAPWHLASSDRLPMIFWAVT
jgi:hypothetical protein